MQIEVIKNIYVRDQCKKVTSIYLKQQIIRIL